MRKSVLWALLILIAGDTLAGSFRCGRMLVTVGDSSSALLKKCGTPVRKYNSKETVSNRGRQVRVAVSNWVYERRGNRKDMIVSVRDGTVVRIEVD